MVLKGEYMNKLSTFSNIKLKRKERNNYEKNF